VASFVLIPADQTQPESLFRGVVTNEHYCKINDLAGQNR